jgi:thiamine biosynthesis lipoprotein
MTRSRHVEHHLGTAITLCVDGAPPSVVEDFFGCIASHEAALSRFRPGSEISRVAAGEIAVDETSSEVREVLTQCERLRFLTRGDFEHEPRRRSGDPADPVLDTNAFAKGWIIEQACLGLRMNGVRSFFVNAGGDIVAATPPAGRAGWCVGIRDPADAASVRAILTLDRAALATSGRYERGDHIRRSADSLLASVSVVGPDLAIADALATAIFTSGSVVPSWWDHDGEYAVIAIDTGGRLRWTSNAARFGLEYRAAA